MARISIGALLMMGCRGACADAYTPPPEKVANPAPNEIDPGLRVRKDAVQEATQTSDATVAVDAELLELGEAAFYEETFGNEVFLTDVLGMLAGPLDTVHIAKAIAGLKGRATSDLRVELAKDAVIGGRHFGKGERIDTGLDVARGSVMPIGMKIRLDGGKVLAGITCALCHSTVDRGGSVVHGAPNSDLNVGLLLALATNSASYFTHTDVDPRTLPADPRRRVRGSDGELLPVPEIEALEQAVDAVLVQWPPGSFDSMTDLMAAPAQIPASFTRDNHPYSFSGAFAAGPFHGLSVQNNNVHGLNADPTVEADQARPRMGIDAELFLAIMLQNAAAARYRWSPDKNASAKAFMAEADPTPGQPGFNQMVALPGFPRASVAAPAALWTSDPGRPVWQKVNAMSAWQNTLDPPNTGQPRSDDAITRGRAVFERAGCDTCHSGPGLTNHRIVPVAEIGTQAVRAKALASTERIWDPNPLVYSFDTMVPLPAKPTTRPLPGDSLDPAQVELAFAHHGSEGGYKVMGLRGLSVSAPYLHDGGVAVGANPGAQLGIAKTIGRAMAPDPGNSLRALIDRDLRGRVIRANHADKVASRMHVEGIGHEIWVDPAGGYALDDQRALIAYLLNL